MIPVTRFRVPGFFWLHRPDKGTREELVINSDGLA